uniref:MHC class I-like antigen recognition-like domain-containing protein n=1 Tax=Leptobrachium leishanense TaxID=445787 RepID=A0A8C5PUB3_9ANUR
MCLSVSGHSLSDMCLSVSGHSLQYYHTGVSVPGHELPLYTSVGYVDGIEITRYSSDTGRSVPVAPWMQKVEDPDYWEEETQNGKRAEAVNKHNVKKAMHRFNQTGGFHSFQGMYGCELRGDGSTRGYQQYGYDGKDFLALDTERWVYYPITDQAQLSVQKWNSPEQRAGERAKYYLETDCIDWLRNTWSMARKEREERCVQGMGEELERRGVCRVWGRSWRGEVCAGYGGGAGEERCVQGMGEELERRGVCRVWGGAGGEVGAGCGGGAGEERCVQGMGEELERRGVCRVWGRAGGEVGAGCGGGAGEERCVQGVGEELEREVCAGCGGGAGEERCVQGMGEGRRRGVCRVWGRSWRGEVGAGYGGGLEERWVQGMREGLEEGGCRVWGRGWRRGG